LVTPEVGAAELLIRWRAGHVLPAERWAAEVPRLLADLPALRAAGRRGQQRVLEELDWRRLAERFESAYQGAPRPRARAA
jgi:glycosyltransferase involved in cell wall biosynthesis